MAKHTIYIREADEAKWQAIEDKPDWIHGNLQGTPIPPDTSLMPKRLKHSVIKDFAGNGKQSTKLCEHYQARGQCLIKGCKFGRK